MNATVKLIIGGKTYLPIKGISYKDLSAVFEKALSEGVAIGNRLRMLTWLRDEGDVSTTRYLKSLSDMAYALVLEDFKRKKVLQEKNLKRTPPDGPDKAPVYDESAPGGSSTPDSPGAQMVPRDPSFLNSTRDYLKNAETDRKRRRNRRENVRSSRK